MTPISYFNNFQEFNKLSDIEISKIIESRLKDNNTMVYAYDGTRRSYLIENTTKLNNCKEHQETTLIDYDEYCKTAIQKLLFDLVMMFKHGIKTIVYPMWFCTLEDRGSEYLPKFIKYLGGLNALLENQELIKLYKENEIRVIFYGEYLNLLQRGSDPTLVKKFESIMEQTKHNTRHTILFGTTIEEPSQTIINNTIEYYCKNNGSKPTKKDLIQQYYGLPIDQVSIYVGFDRFSTDGRPIYIADKGNEDLYYTISPHSFFSKNNFRKILFDKLFCRSNTNAKEYELKVIDIEMMKHFYESNSSGVMGIGNVNPYGNYWYPSPQVQLPITFKKFNETINQFKKLELNNINNNNTNNINNSNNTNNNTNNNINVAVSSGDGGGATNFDNIIVHKPQKKLYYSFQKQVALTNY